LPQDLPLTIPANLVAQRPDVRAAEAQLHAANAELGVAIANELPQITLTGTSGTTAVQVVQLLGAGTGFWAIGGSLVQTVLDGERCIIVSAPPNTVALFQALGGGWWNRTTAD
jgi:outer membrane protein TolC